MDLEEELGKKLFIRSGRRLTLTEDGLLLRKRASEIIDLVEKTQAEVMERDEAVAGNFGLMVGSALDKYDSILLPAKDVWGVLMPKDHPLSAKAEICPEDLRDQPLILSRHSDPGVSRWMHTDLSKINVVATYSLLYNASLMVREGLGLALGLDKFINTTGDSRLCFRPLPPPA